MTTETGRAPMHGHAMWYVFNVIYTLLGAIMLGAFGILALGWLGVSKPADERTLQLVLYGAIIATTPMQLIADRRAGRPRSRTRQVAYGLMVLLGASLFVGALFRLGSWGVALTAAIIIVGGFAIARIGTRTGARARAHS